MRRPRRRWKARRVVAADAGQVAIEQAQGAGVVRERLERNGEADTSRQFCRIPSRLPSPALSICRSRVAASVPQSRR
jgi:hypothetical protein